MFSAPSSIDEILMMLQQLSHRIQASIKLRINVFQCLLVRQKNKSNIFVCSTVFLSEFCCIEAEQIVCLYLELSRVGFKLIKTLFSSHLVSSSIAAPLFRFDSLHGNNVR
ncbi:hypothetical protein CDAR_23001 [Caerostris darwini]|uniref:Uncharacterized protein n=1 Tax=Caerostris darwini TaxID=1538125 RepID=A0AAV4WRR5_9ARAC|nr:hypothetical protein CDAR_23001 [Caerostris darwini]